MANFLSLDTCTRRILVPCIASKLCPYLQPYDLKTCVSSYSTLSRHNPLTIPPGFNTIRQRTCCQSKACTACRTETVYHTLNGVHGSQVHRCSPARYLHSCALSQSILCNEGALQEVNRIVKCHSSTYIDSVGKQRKRTVLSDGAREEEILGDEDFYGIRQGNDDEFFSDTETHHLEENKARSQSQLPDSDPGSRDVHVAGNANRATDTYRKRTEKRALREDADPTSAATVAVRIRKELKEKTKQSQRDGEDETVKPKARDMRHQVNDLSKLQQSTVASILTKCVIYNKGDIVAIDKPYGLPSHGGPGVKHNIDSLLPLLARKLAKKGDDNPALHLVHRLDKETTGVMVLAKTEDMLRRLQAMFRQRKVIKKYWVITAGVPDPPSGVIDMPMAEMEIGNRYRMVVKPDLSSVQPGVLAKRRKASATDAVTKFKVLDSSKRCALVELEAMTGVKHQIRVHLAQGMACPILGDHKYSHFNKQAPQRLPYSMLLLLGITQQKVRTVPMHLHAQMLFLPEFFEDGGNLRISTKLPKFFATNMRKLKLKVP